MRIKNFTLMLVAVLFSAVSFAQKSLPARQDIAIDRLAKVLPLKQTQTVQSLTKQCAVQTTPAATPQNNPAPRAASKARAMAPEVVTPPEDGEMEYYTLTGSNSRSGETSKTVKLVCFISSQPVRNQPTLQCVGAKLPNLIRMVL